MNYFKINGVDFSNSVNALKINLVENYNAQTNAAGDGVVDYINSKRTIDVGIIPLDANEMARLQEAIDSFNVVITVLNPKTNALEDINCIIPSNNVEYYTIQAHKVTFKAFNLQFIEL